MRDEGLFNEKRNILFAKSQEEGFVSLSALRELSSKFELTKDEFADLYNYFETNKVLILLPFEIYHRKLRSKQSKIVYCYFLLACHIRKEEIDPNLFNIDVENKVADLIKAFIKRYLNPDQTSFVKTFYGIDTGEFLLDDDKTINTLKWSLTKYLNVKKSTFNVFNNSGSVTLATRIDTVRKYTAIDEYDIRTVTFGSKKNDTLIFLPMTKGRDVVGPVIMQEIESKHTSIGFLKNPGQLAFALTIYNDDADSYGINFYNAEKSARPELYATKTSISFGTYYPGLGYHGNQYTFEKGQKVNVNHAWEGKNLNDHPIAFDSPSDIYRGLKYDQFSKCKIQKIVQENFTQYVGEMPDNNVGFACRIFDNGAMMIGQFIDNDFNGVVMYVNSNGSEYRFGIAINGNPLKDFYVEVSKFFEIITYHHKNDERTINLKYAPLFIKNEMELIEFDKDDKEIRKVSLSAPLFRTVGNMKEASPANGKGTPEEKLNSLIGLDSVKKHIKRLKALFIKRKEDEKKQSLHMVFTGNPGTGKTEVARLLAGIMYDEGIISENKFVEVGRSDLVGGYIGQSEEKTKKIIESAMGGVLFIDEAYSLYSSDDDGRDYGNKVMDELVKAMEDYRDKLCIIFAGYKKPMEKLMNMNPGFQSRVSYVIDFPDYSKDELILITKKFITDNNYQINDDALNEIAEVVDMNRDTDNFGNARDVRKILENLFGIQAERTESDLKNRLITLEDINTYEDEQHVIKQKMDNTIDIDLSVDKISKISNSLADTFKPFIYTNRYVEEASVNIKIIDKKSKNVEGEGTGFFITNDGLIATCAHVINKTENKDINVIVNIFTDKGKKITKSYQAGIVGYDDKSDVGLIQLLNCSDNEFSFYPLMDSTDRIPQLRQVVMAGYPLGGERFEKISINEGKAQSYNKDTRLKEGQDEIERLYLDLFGVPGNSGSGVIDKETGLVVGVFAGSSVGHSGSMTFELNYSIPVVYLWNLIISLENAKKGK